MAEPDKVQELFKKLMDQPIREFPAKRQKLDAPNDQGVYVIYDRKGRVVHVGGTPRGKRGIAQRLRNHMSGHRPLRFGTWEKRAPSLGADINFGVLLFANRLSVSF